jgi:heme exporter protein D
MKWGSWSEFLAMGGYGAYVWVSVGATALGMLGEVLALRRRHAAAVGGSRDPQARTQAQR